MTDLIKNCQDMSLNHMISRQAIKKSISPVILPCFIPTILLQGQLTCQPNIINSNIRQQQPAKRQQEKLMQVITVVECDSIDSEDPEAIERLILQREGPTLGQVYSSKVPKLFQAVSSASFIKALPDRGGKEVNYIGNSQDAAFRAFYYLLLHIQLEERRSYPHLRNIIRQQLNKEHILRKQQEELIQKSKDKKQRKKSRRDSRDNICDMYFQLVHQWGRIQDFLLKNRKFDGICLNMIQNLMQNKANYFPISEEESLKNDEKSTERREKDNQLNRGSQARKLIKKTSSTTDRNIGQEYQFLCKVFNIDFEIINDVTKAYSVYRMGSSKRFFVINESGNLFVVLLGLQLSNSGRKYSNQESELMSNASTPLLQQVLQASDESTPKFIEGHESSIRYRKKSHKNSFGGDIDIVSYKDLGSSLHQFQDNKKARQKLQKYIESQKKNPEKVFSARFETQEMGELEQIDQEESKQQKTGKGNQLEQPEQFVERYSKKNNVTHVTMRKSHCITKAPNFENFLDRGKKMQESNNYQMNSSRRRKRMSSSACLQQQQAEKLAVFNNKISFSKHDRNKFLVNREREQPPERQPSDTMSSAHYESTALHNNIASIKSNLINTYASPQSKAMQIVMMGNHKRMIDSRIVELPLEEIQRSNWSDQLDQAHEGDGRNYHQGVYGNQVSFHNQVATANQAIIEILDQDARDKLQNRKFSYFPEKVGMSPTNKNRADLLNKSANEVGINGGTPQHRQQPPTKQRFQENILTLNQLDRSTASIPMGSPTRAIQRFNSYNINGGSKLQIAKKVVDFFVDQQKEPEPEGWIRKEITYFFANNKPSETKGYFPPQKKDLQFNISLTKSTDRRFRPYDNSLREMKKSDFCEGRSIIYEKESYLQGPALIRKESTAQKNGSIVSKLHMRNASSFNHNISPNRLQGQKRASNYTAILSPTSNTKNSYDIDMNRKHSVSYSLYSRRATIQQPSQPQPQPQNHKNSFAVQSPQKRQNNAILQTSLSGRNIRQESPQGSQGNRSGRNMNAGQENTPKMQPMGNANVSTKVRESINSNGRVGINYFSKNTSHGNCSTNTSSNNVVSDRNAGNLSSNNLKYRPFNPNLINAPNKAPYSQQQQQGYSHPNGNYANNTPTNSNNNQHVSNSVISKNSDISDNQSPIALQGTAKHSPNPHGKAQTITLQQFQIKAAGSPVNANLNMNPNSPNKGSKSPSFHMTTAGCISPTNIMQNSDPNESHGQNPDLQYSTSMEHLLISSPKHTTTNIIPNDQRNRERMEKALEQSKHHRASFNFVLIQGNGTSRDVNHDSPNHSNSGRTGLNNGNNGFNQGITSNRYRPPSNTGTVSSRANTNANNGNNGNSSPNSKFLYYRM